MLPHALQNQLSQLISQQEIVSDATPFQLDQRRRFHSPNTVVVQPKNIESIQKIIHFSQQHQLPIIPQGGNTGLVGGTAAERGIIVNLSKLNQIRNISLADNAITVEAGCILHHVQAAAAQAGRFFPLSLASEGSCQIGGNIATNAGGLNVVRYGTMRDLVLGLEVVLPNGDVVSHLTPLHKNTTGYDLKHLFIGSEGTLGIITAATLKLFAPICTTATAWVGIDNIEQAIHLLTIIQRQFAERLSSFELISAFALDLSSKNSKISIPTQAKWHILLELTDSLPDLPLTDNLAQCLWKNGFENSILAQSEQERQQMWRLRENISAAQKNLGVSIKHDIALPIDSIADFIHKTEQTLETHFPTIHIVVFGHLGDGSLHYNTFLPDVLDNQAYEYEDLINQMVYQHVFEYRGTIAAEHGIGRIKKHWLPHVRHQHELALMHAIKAQLDPLNLFNPDKLFS